MKTKSTVLIRTAVENGMIKKVKMKHHQTIPMKLIETNDADLRNYIYSEKCVIVKYYSPNTDCQYCKVLEEPYQKLSSNPNYNNILFLNINANQNPVAKEAVKKREMPFIVTYKNGLLVQCGSVKIIEDIVHMLDNLLNKKEYK